MFPFTSGMSNWGNAVAPIISAIGLLRSLFSTWLSEIQTIWILIFYATVKQRYSNEFYTVSYVKGIHVQSPNY